jgi:hypothetical protein
MTAVRHLLPLITARDGGSLRENAPALCCAKTRSPSLNWCFALARLLSGTRSSGRPMACLRSIRAVQRQTSPITGFCHRAVRSGPRARCTAVQNILICRRSSGLATIGGVAEGVRRWSGQASGVVVVAFSRGR